MYIYVYNVCIMYQTSSFPSHTNVILSLCKRITFCICICICICFSFCCCIRIMTISSMFPFAGGPLCFYWLSTCVGSDEKREGQVKARGDLFHEIVHYILTLYVIYVAQVDMISLGTYLKRFNFKLHSRQVGNCLSCFNWTRTFEHEFVEEIFWCSQGIPRGVICQNSS